MDPNLRELLRAFLADDSIAETVGPEGQRKLLELVAEPALAPHLVHVDGAVVVDEIEVVKTYDPERGSGKAHGHDLTPARHAAVVHPETGAVSSVEIPEFRMPYWMIETRSRRHVGPIDCPDCGRGLSSRGQDLICPRLPASTAIRGETPGDIVACGLGG